VGTLQNVVGRLRRAFVADKERGGDLLAKGATAPTYPDSGYDLLQAYGYDALSDYLRLEHDLLSRYVDYEEMDDSELVASAVDIYADDASQYDAQLQRSVWITSPDTTLQGVLDDLFYKQLRMDEEIWEITRSLVKYGNNIEELLVTEDGVVGLNFLPAPTVRRVEGPRGELYGFVQDFRGRFGYCLASGSRVWGNRSGQGVVEIQNFDRGAVLGWKNDQPALLPVKQLHANGKRRVVCLRTRHREVFLTEDHPVLARQGKKGDFAWTKVKDLRIEYNGRTDKKPDLAYHQTAHVMVATRMPGGEVPTWDAVWGERSYQPSSNPTATGFSLPERPTKDFVRLFGYMLGNGWVREQGGSKVVGFAIGEYPEINQRYVDIFSGLGVKANVRENFVDVCSLNFANFFEACGWINGFANKRIPPWMFFLPEGYREELLWGFIDADGSTRAPGKYINREKFVAEDTHVDRFGFSVSNYDLARDFKNLIDGLGYVAGNLCEWLPKAHESKGKWISTDKLAYHIGFANAKFVEPFVAESVLSIEDAGESEVYDVEVNDDAHNFVSDGVVVHNSPQEFQKILAQRTDSIRNMMQPGMARPPGNYLQQVAALEPWEVVHMRLRGKHRRSIYGWSVLEPARWIWKRLLLLEDSALIYRLQRAPERFAFYVDVGDLPPAEALAFVNKIRQTHKKKRFTNPSSGKLDLRFDPLPVAFDTPIPLLDGRVITIAEMSREYSEGKKNWVYSLDPVTRTPVAGEVSWVGLTRENGQALKVTFDDGGSAIMAPDHPVMLRDGTYREVELLRIGDQVAPLYRHPASKGYSMRGYEVIFNASSGKYEYTHRLIMESLGLRVPGEVTHHKDLNKLNNDPRNLVSMPKREHIVLHGDIGLSFGQRTAELRKHDPGLDSRLRAIASQQMRVFNASPARRALTVKTNRSRDQAGIVRRYNESVSHTEHNTIRAEKKRAFWKDEERAKKARLAMTHRFPEVFVSGVTELVRSDEVQTAVEVVQKVNAGPLLKILQEANLRKPIREVHRHLLLKVYRSVGCRNFEDFKRVVRGNHKVVSIEEVPPCDHYCMTVERWHNFALLLRDSQGLPMNDSGVFVKNSSDDDFWVPVRKGVEGTRIEVLGAPAWQCLVGETCIPLLDGTQPTIKELSERGGDFWLYSVDSTGRLVPGRGWAARKTHESAEIWEVGLDNGEVIRCTGNHPFLSRDGKWILAEHLRSGDSLMPLYRKASRRADGAHLEGYEQVYDPSADRYVYTHHRVFESLHEALSMVWGDGKVIHHANHCKTDNNPDNLKAVSRKAHALEHAEFVRYMHTPEAKAKARASKRRPEVRARLRALWTAQRHAQHRETMIELMADKVIRADKARILAEWNRSEDHRDRIRGVKHPRWRNLTVADLAYLVLATGARNIKEFIEKGRVSQGTIERVLEAEGVKWNEFALANIPGWVPKGRARSVNNHQVVFVRKTQECSEVYDLTVDTYHNFAVSSGVFVSNSVEDISYFQDKLFSALKVPKAYLAQDENINRATLSAEDVRFCRTVMRVQREVRNGLSKVARVHLAAVNIDPSAVEFAVNMTVPSSIFELAQLEVRNARADLATRMREHVSLHWVLQNVYQLADEDIKVIITERSEDLVREGKAQAEVEKMSAQAQASAAGGGAGGGGEAGAGDESGGMGGEESRQVLNGLKLVERKLRRLRPHQGYGISEEELLKGNREAEKRAGDKLNKIMKSQDYQVQRLREVGELVREVVAARKS